MTTLYCRSDSATVNGLAAYKLLDTNSAGFDGFQADEASPGGASNFYFHHQICVRSSGGSESVIGAYGSAQRTLAASGVGQAPYTDTWSCPATTVGATDSIVVRAAIGQTSAGVIASRAFSTPTNPSSQPAATWSFIRKIGTVNDGLAGDDENGWYQVPAYGTLYWGYSGYPFYIEGVTYTPPAGGVSALPLFIHHYQTQGMM